MASAVDKLAAVSSVPEPRDVDFSGTNLKLWTYSFQGKELYDWSFADQMSDLRVLLNILQASTVEIDLEDDDFEILNDPLFLHWAWDIEDVSFSSQKKFKTTRISNTTNTAYLGDNADLEWVLGQKPIDFELGNGGATIAFRLCGISSQQDLLTLVLEDRAASWLRDQKGALSWGRDQHTRAQFVAMLCRQAGVPYFIPELDVKQPISVSTSASSNPVNNIVNPNGKGLSNTAGLTIFGHPMTATQKSVASVLLGECDRRNAPLVCWQAILYAGVGETRMGTISDTYQDNGHGLWGVLQGADGTHGKPLNWPDPHDIAGMADCFLGGGKGFHPDPGGAISLAKAGVTDMAEIAVKVEGPSNWPDNAYENEWGPALDAVLRGEIDKMIAAYGGPSSTAAGTATTTASYAFTRGANETSYDCIQRLASEVAWYAFVRQGRLWYVSGNYLFSQPPQLTVERGKNGIDYIDLDLDMGERDEIAQLLVYGRTALWTALPGMVVEVVKRGPASGKWIVASVENHPRDASQQCIITLQKPIPKRSEPSTGTSATVNTPSASQPHTVKGVTNPAPGAKWGRLDMGFDGNYDMTQGAVAPFNGTIVGIGITGWPGEGQYFAVLNDDQSGPDYTRCMYFAEGAKPIYPNGTKVKVGQKIGTPVQSGGNGTPGNYEIGPANTTNHDTLAKSYGLGSTGAKSMVLQFASWLQGAGAGSTTDASSAGNV